MRRENDANKEPLHYMLGKLKSALKEVGAKGARWLGAGPRGSPAPVSSCTGIPGLAQPHVY